MEPTAFSFAHVDVIVTKLGQAWLLGNRERCRTANLELLNFHAVFSRNGRSQSQNRDAEGTRLPDVWVAVFQRLHLSCPACLPFSVVVSPLLLPAQFPEHSSATRAVRRVFDSFAYLPSAITEVKLRVLVRSSFILKHEPGTHRCVYLHETRTCCLFS